jgi:hypothetical protein
VAAAARTRPLSAPHAGAAEEGAPSRRAEARKEAHVRELFQKLRHLCAVGGPEGRLMPPQAWAELVKACGGPQALLDGVELLLRLTGPVQRG